MRFTSLDTNMKSNPAISIQGTMDDSAVHIFWDQSNVFFSALDACDDGEGNGFELGHRWDARVNFKKHFEFAAAGRRVEKAIAVGSIPPGLAHLWAELRKTGVAVELQERGADSGKEQAVDEALQLHMLRSLIDHKPAVAVLLSGDGGFHQDVKRMLDAGWGVEVLCFGASMSKKLKGITRGTHGRGKYIDLDPWYRQLVYLQGQDEEGPLRPTETLDLTKPKRPKV
jgi:hypothetical protein